MIRSSSLAASPKVARLLTALTIFGLGVALIPTAACKDTGVGDPCIPELEYNADFLGFDYNEVNFESKSFQCQTRLCLVNHFQGRVSCQYGEDSSQNGPNGLPGCTVPNDPTQKITGNPSLNASNIVKPQCTDRTADKAVYCSCRCANVDGKTDDGANYCDCPDGFTCTQLVASTGLGNEGLTGAFCIKAGSAFDKATACPSECDPTIATCPGPQGPQGS